MCITISDEEHHGITGISNINSIRTAELAAAWACNYSLHKCHERSRLFMDMQVHLESETILKAEKNVEEERKSKVNGSSAKGCVWSSHGNYKSIKDIWNARGRCLCHFKASVHARFSCCARAWCDLDLVINSDVITLSSSLASSLSLPLILSLSLFLGFLCYLSSINDCRAVVVSLFIVISAKVKPFCCILLCNCTWVFTLYVGQPALDNCAAIAILVPHFAWCFCTLHCGRLAVCSGSVKH